MKALRLLALALLLPLSVSAQVQPPTNGQVLYNRQTGALIPTAGPGGTISLNDPVFAGNLPYARLPVGTGANTVAAGNDPRFVTVTPEQFGATVNGTADNTAAFNAAITALGSTGGVIQLAAKTYVLAGNITLPPGVVLRGSNAAPRHRTIANIGQTQETLTNGTIINLTHAAGSDTATASITLQRGATIRDLSLFEPNQSTTATPTPYPFAVRFSDYGCNAINIELVNCYRGIDAQGGRFQISDITGNPLFTGIRVDNCMDFSQIDRVRFVFSWSASYAAAQALVQNSAHALEIGRCDGIIVRDVKTYLYARTVYLFTGTGGYGAYGILDGINSDLSGVCIENQGTGSRTLVIQNSYLIASANAYSAPNGVTGANVEIVNSYLASNSTSVPLCAVNGVFVARGNQFVNSSTQYAVESTGNAIVDVHGNISVGTAAYHFSGGGVHGTCGEDNVIFSGGAAIALVEGGSDVKASNLLASAQYVSATSGTVPISAGTRTVVLTTPLTGAMTLTLPSANRYMKGQEITFLDPGYSTASNTASVVPSGGDVLALNGTIMSPALVLAGAGSARVMSDGSGYWVALTGGVKPQTKAATTNQFLTSYDASTGMFATATVTVPTIASTANVLKGNGTGGAVAAAAGTDFLAPAAIGSTVQAYSATIPTAYLGTTSTTALAGNTALLQLGTTSTTAAAGNDSRLTLAGTAVQSISITTPGVLYSSPLTLNVTGGAATGTLTLINQSANTVLAGPASGASATPTMRALVAADIPAIPESGVTNLTTDLAAKAPLASPAFTGTPSVPTAAAGTNTTQAASTAFVTGAISTSAGLSLLKANNLSDVASASTSRTNLGSAASGTNADITSLTAATSVTSSTNGLALATNAGSGSSITLTARDTVMMLSDGGIGARWTVAGVQTLGVGSNLVRVGSGTVIGISSSTLATGANPDVGLSRLGAGIWAVGNGTQGDFSASFKLTGIYNQGSTQSGAAGTSYTRLRHGVATLSSGSVVVSDSSTTANTRIYLSAQDNNTVGALRVSARTAGTSFTISSSASDTGVVAWEMIEP